MAYSTLGCAMSAIGRVGRAVTRAALVSAVGLVPGVARAQAPDQSAPLVFQSISAGTNHACGITPQHVAYCWGRNVEGQLGNASMTSACSDVGTPCSAKPVRVEGGLSFAVISAGNNFTCGVTTVGTAYCWGTGTQGQLGTGDQASSSSPQRVQAEGVPFLTISAGFSHACAVARTGAAYCWGSNAGGRLGTGTLTGGHTSPALVAGGLAFRTISAGYYHTCGVTRSGTAYCWGRNDQGELGSGATGAHGSPTRVGGALAARIVSAGVQFDYTCAVGRDSTLSCWGANCYGQLGTDSTTEQCGSPAMPCSTTPKAVHATGAIEDVSAFFSHVCALSASGQVTCWGQNDQGQLGNGDESGSATAPTPVAGGATYRAVTTGRQFSCAIAEDGTARCWGRNADGQLGVGDARIHATPTPVVGP